MDLIKIHQRGTPIAKFWFCTQTVQSGKNWWLRIENREAAPKKKYSQKENSLGKKWHQKGHDKVLSFALSGGNNPEMRKHLRDHRDA